MKKAILILLVAFSLAAQAQILSNSKLNVIVVHTDDDWHLHYENNTYIDSFPNIRDNFLLGGINFERFQTVTPVCGPSRAAIFIGQYPHNNGYKDQSNEESTTVAFDYYQRFGENHIGTWMKNAGYNTAMLGKYLNGYPQIADNYIPNYDYVAMFKGEVDYYSDEVTYRDGATPYTQFRMPNCVHKNDYEGELMERFLDSLSAKPEPFFLFWNPYAPHVDESAGGETIFPYRYKNDFSTSTFTDYFPPEMINEADVSDKSHGIQNRIIPPNFWQLAEAQLFTNRLRSIKSMDDQIGRLFNYLDAKGLRNNTIVFYLTDNGYETLNHRLLFKRSPYDECAGYLYVTGAGITQATKKHLVNNLDIAPTILDIAGGNPDTVTIDGLSLLPAINGTVGENNFRHYTLASIPRNDTDETPDWWMVKDTTNSVLIRYDSLTTFSELPSNYQFRPYEYYDLDLDPFQLDNELSNQADTSQAKYQLLIQKLDQLLQCRGSNCNTL